MAKQKRYTSANVAERFNSDADFYRAMASRLRGYCECDGRGCTICIAADALDEAAQKVEQ